jgi:hypothetical protein
LPWTTRPPVGHELLATLPFIRLLTLRTRGSLFFVSSSLLSFASLVVFLFPMVASPHVADLFSGLVENWPYFLAGVLVGMLVGLRICQRILADPAAEEAILDAIDGFIAAAGRVFKLLLVGPIMLGF